MKFQAVNTASNGEGNGKLVIVRGGNLITNGNKETLAPGTELIGKYEGSVANKYNEGKLDFKIRQDDGTLVIFAETSALRKAFTQVEAGTLVQVVFNGKIGIKGGKTYNDFVVSTAMDAE